MSQQGREESWNAGPSTQVIPDLTVGDLLRRAAEESPSFPALRVPDPESGEVWEWDYAALLADSERCARRLLDSFEPGERIAVWSDNRPEWVILQLGAALAGLVLVTVNPAFRDVEARYVIEHSGAVACFAARDYRGAALSDLARNMRHDLPRLRFVLSLDLFPDFLSGPLAQGDLPTVRPEDAVLIQYTSGTTGFPKGATLLHGRLTDNATHVAMRAGLTKNAVWLAPLPLFHAGGCVVGVLGAVSHQATLVLMSAWDPEIALALVESEHVQIINAVPTMLTGMTEHPDLGVRDLSSLTCVLAGGSTVSADIVRRVESRLGATVFIIFGQTECGPVATMTNPTDTPEDKQNTVGTPMPGFEVKIIDPDTGETLPREQLGEFVARGATMAGYHANDEATAAAMDADGWLHTGDLCVMDDRGYLRVEGRLRDMIIRGGENIYPREIEEALLNEPGISDVAIVGLPDAAMGEVVGAFVVSEDPATFDADDLSARLRDQMARYKIPEQWLLTDELPRTATGKIQKFLLKDQWRSGEWAEQ